LPLTGNPNQGGDPYQQKQSFLIPDGIGSKFGYGVHYKKWIAVGVHSGLNWNGPVSGSSHFANFRRSKISDETKLHYKLD
jgi:hypothetical protein